MKLLFFFLGLLLLVGCATEVGVYSPPPPTVIYYRPYCGPCLHNRPFCGPRFHGHYWCPPVLLSPLKKFLYLTPFQNLSIKFDK